MPTLGLVANVYNEINALPGWLELHLPFFDDVRITHAGPQGSMSNDGTIELLEKWRIPIQYCAIDEGFGVVRTKAIHFSPCEYVMLLDADERFYPVHRYMHIDGESTPQEEVDKVLQSYDFRGGKIPDWAAIDKLGAGLRVDVGETYNQGAYLRDLIGLTKPDAVCTIRRHWHTLSFNRPTQNWLEYSDWQMRIVRNHPDIYYDQTTRMHERLSGAGNVVPPAFDRGPFFDHFHFHFKRMEQEQRRHDIEIYDAIHAGEKPPIGGNLDDRGASI